MADSNIDNIIREKSRRDIQIQREYSRQNDVDSIRLGLGEIKSAIKEVEEVTVKDMHGLAVRIKRRRGATNTDLRKLSNGFLQSDAHIVEFMVVRDAVNVIIKVWTGSEEELQVLASDCLCNLSLGDEFCCETLALRAGSYLVTFLTSPNKRLAVGSLWVIANLAKGGDASLNVLLSLNIVDHVAACLELYRDEEIGKESAITLVSIVENSYFEEFGAENCHKILQAIVKSQHTPQFERAKLVYKTLFKVQFQVAGALQLACLEIFLDIMLEMSQLVAVTSEQSTLIIMSIRVLGNLLALNKSTGPRIVEFFLENSVPFHEVINRFSDFGGPPFSKEIMWMLGNFYITTNIEVQKYVLQQGFLKKLKVIKDD